MFPTIGRVVWFYDGSATPRAAIVAHVHSAQMLNLTVFAPDGTTYPRTSVPFVQPHETIPETRFYASWPSIRKDS